jgi:hypothetical protein
MSRGGIGSNLLSELHSDDASRPAGAIGMILLGSSNFRITSANTVAFIPASPTLHVRIDITFQQNLTAQSDFSLVFNAPNQSLIAV